MIAGALTVLVAAGRSAAVPEVVGAAAEQRLDCLWGVNVHNYTDMFGTLSEKMRGHLGTGVTSVYGLGHVSARPTPPNPCNHPTPARNRKMGKFNICRVATPISFS